MNNNLVNPEVPEPGRHECKLVPSWPRAGEGCACVCRPLACPEVTRREREAPVVSGVEPIEEAFPHRQSPNQIGIDYELPDSRALYRHAHATGLFDRVAPALLPVQILGIGRSGHKRISLRATALATSHLPLTTTILIATPELEHGATH